MSFENSSNFVRNSLDPDFGGRQAEIFNFGPFLLNVSERRLMNGIKPVALTPKVFDALVYLVRRKGQLVGKAELMEGVWPDSFVEDVNLTRNIHLLRKALGQSDSNVFIETVPTKGYRFVAEVREVPADRETSELVRSGRYTVDNDVAMAGEAPDGSKSDSYRGRLFHRRMVLSWLILLAVVSVAWFYSVKTPKLSDAETSSGGALQEFKLGRVFVERRYQGDYDKAIEHFEKAIDLDPDYANAYAGKADVKVVQFWRSGSHEDIVQARAAVRKALLLDDSNSYAHTIHCRILTTYDWDHSAAETECRRAIDLAPNDHEAWRELAFVLHSTRRNDDALSAMDRAIALAPTSFNKRSRATLLYFSGRYHEAIEQFLQVAATDPAYVETVRWLIRAYQMTGKHGKAVDAYARLLEGSGTPSDEIAAMRAGFETGGWASVLRHMSQTLKEPSMFTATVFAQLGENDRALEILDEMSKRRAVLLVTVGREPLLKPLEDDPRFEQLLDKIGLNHNRGVTARK